MRHFPLLLVGALFFAAFRPTEKHRKSFFNFPQFFCHLCHVKIYMTSYSIFFLSSSSSSRLRLFHYQICVSVHTSESEELIIWARKRAARRGMQIKIRSYYDYASYGDTTYYLEHWFFYLVVKKRILSTFTSRVDIRVRHEGVTKSGLGREKGELTMEPKSLKIKIPLSGSPMSSHACTCARTMWAHQLVYGWLHASGAPKHACMRAALWAPARERNVNKVQVCVLIRPPNPRLNSVWKFLWRRKCDFSSHRSG
jgi:hypothetical protein